MPTPQTVVATAPSNAPVSTPDSASLSPGAWRPEPRAAAPGNLGIALAGMVALAVAMGLGRFAFTPLLPMMLRDGSLSLAQGSGLATANYLGYFVGAVACALLPGGWRRLRGTELPADRLAQLGLIATLLLLLLMVLPLPSLWPVVRFLAGVASAASFVFTSSWCLLRLAQQGGGRLAGLVFAGPGCGVVIGGLGISTVLAWGGHGSQGWLLTAALAALGLGWVSRVMRADRLSQRPQAAAAAAQPAPIGRQERRPASGHSAGLIGGLVFSYGLAGLGYIVTATFLPVLAREWLPGSAGVDWLWPMFGVGVVLGCLLATRLPEDWNNCLLLAVCYVVQALGVVLGLWWQGLPGLLLGSLLVGLPFTALTLFTLREIRLRWPQRAPALIGLATAVYALGQIVGPPMVDSMLRHSASRAAGFSASLYLAASALLLGAAAWLLIYALAPARQTAATETP